MWTSIFRASVTYIAKWSLETSYHAQNTNHNLEASQHQEFLYKIVTMFIPLHCPPLQLQLLSFHFIHKTTSSTKHPIPYMRLCTAQNQHVRPASKDHLRYKTQAATLCDILNWKCLRENKTPSTRVDFRSLNFDHPSVLCFSHSVNVMCVPQFQMPTKQPSKKVFWSRSIQWDS